MLCGSFYTDSPILLGDINGDGRLASDDISLLIRYLSGEAVSVSVKTADLSGDDRISNLDAIYLITILSKATAE